MAAHIDPFTVRPRVDTKPWGGTRLASLGFAVPPGSDEPIGEVVITAGDSTITSGPYRGQTLAELTAEHHDEVAGRFGREVTRNQPLFPLLIKLIDADQHLSIQVHPDDDEARSLGSLGKTEAWHVLQASLSGQLFLGLRLPNLSRFLEEVRRADGNSGREMRTVPARIGETFVIPAGTVHSLGAGVMVYEVQQPADVTWRLDDWGRVGADGARRPLHVEEATGAIKPYLQPQVIPPIHFVPDQPYRTLLCATRYFALERIDFRDQEHIDLGCRDSPQVLTAVSGRMTMLSGDEPLTITTGQSIVVPTCRGSSHLTGTPETAVLCAWVPNLADDVIAPARRAAVTETAIAALGVTTP